MQHYLEMFYKPVCISYFINCGSPLSQSPGPSEHSGCFSATMWRGKWQNVVSTVDKRHKTSHLLLSLAGCFHAVPIIIYNPAKIETKIEEEVLNIWRKVLHKKIYHSSWGNYCMIVWDAYLIIFWNLRGRWRFANGEAQFVGIFL